MDKNIFFQGFDETTSAYTKWYNYEQLLISTISSGEMDVTEKYLREHPVSYIINTLGELSGLQDLQFTKYYFTVVLTIISHAVIRLGVPASEALMQGNRFLLSCSTCTSRTEISDLVATMLRVFTQLVHNFKVPKNQTYFVKRIDSYIQQHMNEKITVAILAQALNISRNTLTTNFKKDTGLNISTYITLQKIEKAKYLIATTQYSIADISNYLAFSSQSHLQRIFKDTVGMTPLEYRRQAPLLINELGTNA